VVDPDLVRLKPGGLAATMEVFRVMRGKTAWWAKA
jgi:hypothetical protein